MEEHIENIFIKSQFSSRKKYRNFISFFITFITCFTCTFYRLYLYIPIMKFLLVRFVSFTFSSYSKAHFYRIFYTSEIKSEINRYCSNSSVILQTWLNTFRCIVCNMILLNLWQISIRAIKEIRTKGIPAKYSPNCLFHANMLSALVSHCRKITDTFTRERHWNISPFPFLSSIFSRILIFLFWPHNHCKNKTMKSTFNENIVKDHINCSNCSKFIVMI